MMRAELVQPKALINPLFKSAKIQCLILDDSVFDQRRIARALKRTNLEIETWEVSSLDEFRATIELNTFDILFVDFRLPEGSGFDALRALAKTKAGQASKVVWVTGDMSYDWETMHDVIGVDAFIDKSDVSKFDFKDLINRIMAPSQSRPKKTTTAKPPLKTL